LEIIEKVGEARATGLLPRRRRGHPTDASLADAWIEHSTSLGLLEAGIALKCRECLANDFLRLGRFGDSTLCPRCGFTDKTSPIPAFGYALAQVAHLFLGFYGDITALALAAMQRRARVSFLADFEHRIEGAAYPRGRELDLFAVVDGQFVVGEAKHESSFVERDFQLLRGTALRLRASTVVLASDRNCDGGCDDACTNANRSATMDTSLPAGTNGPRERMLGLRADLEPRGCQVVVLCRRSLYGPVAEDDELPF
jgi:hypothetical protein